MNPFINSKKRGVSLPSGCKDLLDVLQRPERGHDSAARRFIHLVLSMAQLDRATEIIIGAATPSGDTPMRYKVEETWYDLLPFPSHIRPHVIAELVRMARFHAGHIPGEGVLDESFDGVRLRWTVAMTSADEDCVLARVQD